MATFANIVIPLVLAGAVAILLSACGHRQEEGDGQQAQVASNSLEVLAGSELKDIEPLLPQIEQATGVHLHMHYAGTLEAVERLGAGEAFSFAWLASNRYALLTPEVKSRIKASERTMLTPVVLGLKQSRARSLGWDNNPKLTWADIAQAAGQGKLRFAMTNPASSNTGFSALLGLAAALSGKGDALEEKDVDGKQLGAFVKAQALTAGSSGWLADAYVREQDNLDGMINYASVLYAANQNGKLKEPLTLIYPKDGVVTADYPFMLIDEGKRAEYDKLVTYLKSPAFQQAMSSSTFRQPITPGVKSAVPVHDSFELAFPSRLAVVNKILDEYENTYRRPADSTFVVDVSGSMDGDRIDALKAALNGLTGADSSLSGRFSHFHSRENITIDAFNGETLPPVSWELGKEEAANQQVLKTIAAYAAGLHATGGTAIFSAVQKNYLDALARQARQPDRVYSIVLMTDGENTNGINMEAFQQWFQTLPADQRHIHIFTVLFGEAKPAELQTLADLTGGRVFDGKAGGLSAAFKDIRGYQ
jgi:Ca-activated chloride channel family protein